MKSQDQLAQNWFIFNVFGIFGFLDFVLALFPLCLFWTYIFLAKNGTNQLKWGHSIITFALRGWGRAGRFIKMRTEAKITRFLVLSKYLSCLKYVLKKLYFASNFQFTANVKMSQRTPSYTLRGF